MPRLGTQDQLPSTNRLPTSRTRNRTGSARRSGRPDFRVAFAERLLPLLHAHITDALEQRGHEMEVGGIWIGEFDGSGGALNFTIEGFTEAGPNAVCARESILFDAEYQARMLAGFQLQHPRVGNMGCFHRHPGTAYDCSSGDRETDACAVADSDTRALVFTIITLDPESLHPLSIRYRNLRFDFFIMSERTSFEYRRIRPILLDTPVLQLSPALAQLSMIRGPGILHDLGALKRMSGLGGVSIHRVEGRTNGGIWLQCSLTKHGEGFRIWVKEDGALHAFIDESGGTREFPGPWEEPALGRHVWLSHLAHEILSRSLGDASIRYGLHTSGLLEDKKRLVAEVRAMQERFGDRAVLRSQKGRLYWEYTVEESGRRFPIEVHYPKHYPARPPRVYSVLPLPHSPHQLVNNELCWIDQFSARGDWNPARDTAAVSVNAAHRWFACLLVYLSLGQWPIGADDQPSSLRAVSDEPGF